MKYLMCVLMCCAISVSTIAQDKAEETKEKAKQRSERRLDNKVDNAIEGGLDKLEGLFKKKNKKKKRNLPIQIIQKPRTPTVKMGRQDSIWAIYLEAGSKLTSDLFMSLVRI